MKADAMLSDFLALLLVLDLRLRVAKIHIYPLHSSVPRTVDPKVWCITKRFLPIRSPEFNDLWHEANGALTFGEEANLEFLQSPKPHLHLLCWSCYSPIHTEKEKLPFEAVISSRIDTCSNFTLHQVGIGAEASKKWYDGPVGGRAENH